MAAVHKNQKPSMSRTATTKSHTRKVKTNNKNGGQQTKTVKVKSHGRRVSK